MLFFSIYDLVSNVLFAIVFDELIEKLKENLGV